MDIETLKRKLWKMTEKIKRIIHDWASGKLEETEEALTEEEIAELPEPSI
jgi:hypothetical protein